MPNSAGTGSRRGREAARRRAAPRRRGRGRWRRRGARGGRSGRVDGEDGAAAGAEGLQRRDGRGLALEVRPHRRGDADAADREAGEADQDQEGAEPVDEAADPRRRRRGGRAIAGRSRRSGRRRRRAAPRGRRRGRAAGGRRKSNSEPGARSPLAARSAWRTITRGPKLTPPAMASGSATSASARRKSAVPSRTRAPGASPSRSTSTFSATSPGRPSCGASAVGEAAAAGEPDAGRRAGRAPSTALTCTRCASARRRPAGTAMSERKSTISETAVAWASIQARSARVGEAVGELDLGVAAEERRRLAGEAVLDGGAHRADRGDRRHPEREAGEKDAEPGEPAAQLAQRQPGGDRQPHRRGFPCAGR